MVAGNEKEATILENNLIKEHRPRFNIKLRDDKDFITLRLGAPGGAPHRSSGAAAAQRPPSGVPAEERPVAAPAESERRGAAEWPRLEVVRRPTPDGSRYFGPYHSATSARRTLHLVNKHFQLRTCSDVEFANRKRPCLQHQIKRCPAPCVRQVSPDWYAEQVDAVAKFLEGRHDELSRELQAKMRQAAREMRFELAAVYRDPLRAIEKVREEQRVVTIDDVDRDVLGFYREGELVEIALLHVRGGKLADVATYSIRQAEIPDEEIVAAFLAQHHGAAVLGKGADDPGEPPEAALVPDEIILPCEPEGLEGIAEWLADRAGHKVALLVPKRGHRVDLLRMANDNARHCFVEKQRRSDDVMDRLRDLQERLRLATVPRRIECCDISHLGGGDTVGAIVAMKDGELDKKRYRSFNVRGDAMPRIAALSAGADDPGSASRGAGPDAPAAGERARPASGLNDDYGAMYEVLARRFRRALKSEALPETLAEPAHGGAAPLGSGAPAPLLRGPARRTRATDVRPGGAAEAKRVTPATPGSAADADVDPAAETEAAEERDDSWDLPDLFVVDGGRGQLAVALAAAHDLGLHELAVIALAKERETALGEALTDRVYLPGQKNPIPLKSNTTSLFLLARLRDEAHRFSNRARMRLGKRRRMRSPLDDVKGLGDKAKKALRTHIGNLAAIRAAPDAELLAVPGIAPRHVKALRAAFPPPPPAEDLAPAAPDDVRTNEKLH
ncbi:MAG: excinuclease ABC subunit UvrC [Myxococcales bacterium]|nr:excinuclease ABC subunit UvrC [Myxococcales bacterium]